MFFKLRSFFIRRKQKKIVSRFGKIGLNYQLDESINLIHPENIYIGKAFVAGYKCNLQTWPVFNNNKTGYETKLFIGDNVSLMSFCHVSCANSIKIGNGVLLGDNVFITDNYHGNNSRDDLLLPPLRRDLFSKGPVIIGDNVWIGRNACIMPNVHIGEGAVIGANSVVTHDVPPFGIFGGVPAKSLKKTS